MNNGTINATYVDIVNEEKSTIDEKKLIFYRIIKRVFDIICACLGIIFMVPVTILVKICYMLSGDFKSIFFVQKRIGKNGKEFYLYKYRTMVPNADAILFKLLKENKKLAKEYKINKKLKNDPRITKMGRILRRTSIDELPQCYNVLYGDMAIIGNRPYLPREKEDMGEYFEQIVKTKPGLTGYWQTAGRSKTTFKKRLELESFYSNNCGIRMDLKIFFLTFSVVLFGKGAK